jgi:hypothetical protein
MYLSYLQCMRNNRLINEVDRKTLSSWVGTKMSTHPTLPRNWWILGMQAITDNLKQTTLCYIPEDLLLTLSPWRSVFAYGSWNGFAQPWYRVWPSMVVPSQPLQSHNDDWSTFTPALSARSRPSRNVIPLGAFEQSVEAPVCFIMSVRPSVHLSA